MTSKVDVTGWKAYIREIRTLAPAGYEAASTESGMGSLSTTFFFQCYMSGMSAKDCVEQLVTKFKVVEDVK